MAWSERVGGSRPPPPPRAAELRRLHVLAQREGSRYRVQVPQLRGTLGSRDVISEEVGKLARAGSEFGIGDGRRSSAEDSTIVYRTYFRTYLQYSSRLSVHPKVQY